jgi:hypothetical protein
MKRGWMLVLGALALGACSPFNTVPLSRESTPMSAFLADREACMQVAGQCIAQKYAKVPYNGASGDRLYPSRGMYLRCMATRGYYPSNNGFTPPVLTLMTDYPPGRDC